MDANRFDAITKALLRLPRRQVLGGLAAGTLGTLLVHGRQEAGAQVLACRRSRNCPKGQACVNKSCVVKCVNGDPFECDGGIGTGCPSGCSPS